MTDTDFLLAKRVITDKLYQLLHEFTNVLKSSPVHQSFSFPAGADWQTGKISRGENYKGLPYVILDFPKLFEKENIFAFRTMFWWGNYLSFTLHLKGEPLEQYRNSIVRNLSKIRKREVLLCSGQDEWEHDLDNGNFNRLEKKSATILQNKDFIKLSVKMKLSEHSLLLKKGLETYELFLGILSC